MHLYVPELNLSVKMTGRGNKDSVLTVYLYTPDSCDTARLNFEKYFTDLSVFTIDITTDSCGNKKLWTDELEILGQNTESWERTWEYEEVPRLGTVDFWDSIHKKTDLNIYCIQPGPHLRGIEVWKFIRTSDSIVGGHWVPVPSESVDD